MLRVTVELVPLGVENRKRTLSVMEIANTGRGTLTRGEYVGAVVAGSGMGSRWELKDFPRKREGPWELLRRLLNEQGD